MTASERADYVAQLLRNGDIRPRRTFGNAMTDSFGRRPSETRWQLVASVGLLFAAYSFWTGSIPGSNEPHYLCKAKFWWQPQWCSQDLFLSSSNPHLVFYVAVGWLAKWLPLGWVAIVSRLIGYFTLAAGWEWLCRALKLNARATVLAACLLLFFAATVSLSGEWLVGGIESKVFAYAAVFAGTGAVLERRAIATGVLFGAAIAFHSLVGVWSVAAVVFGGLASWLLSWTTFSTCSARWNRAPQGFVLFVVIAAAGIVPALMSISGDDPRASFEATFIQVFYRLNHHLHPMTFPLRNYVVYIAMGLFGWWVSKRLILSPALIWLRWLVVGSVLIAACGWIAGYDLRPEHHAQRFFNLRMTALKFYPFRLVDALIPVFVSLVTAQWLIERADWNPRSERSRRGQFMALLLVGISMEIGRGTGAARYLPVEREADWLQVCQWVRSHTPENALFVTPNESWAFKWFAERAEYVAFKDCPQDAQSLVEWNERLRWLDRWAERGFVDTTYSEAEVAALMQHSKATHFVTRLPARLEAPEVFRNDSYAIYELAPARD